MADIKKTLGGDRIGAGKKMQVELDGYIRSNFDLSMVNRFSQAPGTIVPCYCNIGQKGDTWNFDLSALVRTKPTTGPLYGSFKFEVLFFAADIRLYNGALHNNALNLGLNMQNVVYPKMQIPIAYTREKIDNGTSWAWQIQSQNMNPSALMAYLGVTNPGSTPTTAINNVTFRWFNAMPLLMYWDVVKNYFLNKQEDQAWYIGCTISSSGGTETAKNPVNSAVIVGVDAQGTSIDVNKTSAGATAQWPANSQIIYTLSDGMGQDVRITPGTPVSNANAKLIINMKNKIVAGNPTGLMLELTQTDGTGKSTISVDSLITQWTQGGTNNEVQGFINYDKALALIPDNCLYSIENGEYTILINRIYSEVETTGGTQTLSTMELKQFPIENLDRARGIVLKNFFNGENVEITGTEKGSATNRINFPPYSATCEVGRINEVYKPHNSQTQNGLAIKTYSNDIFNAFLNSETIQQINQQTAASITNGQLNISNLILAEKIYKLQNKIAVAGGTYEDWQEAVYGVPTAPANESPKFIGGMTSEIVFDEVVASSATEVGGEVSPLGSLGGRGSLNGQKGGRFELEVKEDCIIMGLCCITPRIDYSQGNKWFMNLQNNDQLHKPELDRIGFQNLMGDWMCGADTNAAGGSSIPVWGQQKAYAMQPAWEHYMTAFNECHGDFADEQQAMYMTLNRRYEVERDGNNGMKIADFTSYIDPTKYNYAFADTTIESQNFWTQIGMDIKVRRVMSSKIMPNL